MVIYVEYVDGMQVCLRWFGLCHIACLYCRAQRVQFLSCFISFSSTAQYCPMGLDRIIKCAALLVEKSCTIEDGRKPYLALSTKVKLLS